MMAVIRGDTWNLVLLLFLRTSHHGYTLVTDIHIKKTIQLNVYENTNAGITKPMP